MKNSTKNRQPFRHPCFGWFEPWQNFGRKVDDKVKNWLMSRREKYRERLKSTLQVVWMLQASWGRSDKQEHHQPWCTDFSRSLYIYLQDLRVGHWLHELASESITCTVQVQETGSWGLERLRILGIMILCESTWLIHLLLPNFFAILHKVMVQTSTCCYQIASVS